jgi:hypothetical protein
MRTPAREQGARSKEQGARSKEQGAKELWGSGSQYRSMRYRTDAALLAMPDGWPMHQPYRCRAVGHASWLANDARYESQTYIQ